VGCIFNSTRLIVTREIGTIGTIGTVFILHKIMIYISIYINFNPKFASSVYATFHAISSKIAALPIIYLPNRNFCTTK
jgi:hypothetical protein